MKPQAYDWDFPLTRTHAGILQGNGTLGVIAWGERNTLRITLGRADHWDHRGGMPWTDRMSYAAIRDCLERKDEPGLRSLFERTESKSGEPARPSIIPIGRIEIDLGAGAELKRGRLNLSDGSLRIAVARRGVTCAMELHLDMSKPVLAIALPKALGRVRIRPIPAWDSLRDKLEPISFVAPRRIVAKHDAGWVQPCPADPAACVLYRQEPRRILVAVTRGGPPEAAEREARALLREASDAGLKRLTAATRAWWTAYWKSLPHVEIPDERLSFLYAYGLYKFASFTNPAGVPASLQGPWIEDYQMPPWSSDYHFNINVQMCYQPAYHSGRLQNLRPLFDMIFSWEKTLRHNAKVFLGIDDGVMLPHAVDDRCMCMGGFWTGSVDHGCTAWVALMMHRYYRYSMDVAFLRKAYPFMVGAMRVYEKMLEESDGRLSLPVSVSPEYRGSMMTAWGRNASFQLACIHALCECLVSSARALGEAPEPQWTRVMEHLPKACLSGDAGAETIALWDGVELEESHRHHSHLAGIAPFDILDSDVAPWRDIVARSLARWIYRGPGLWSGWCIPWASMIHSHVGNADAAALYLDVFDRVFTNEGHGTLHDANRPGFTLMGVGAIGAGHSRPEIMQMDGGMGTVAAIQEMLIHTRRGVNHLFAGAPARWKQVSFRGMLTDGAFRVSARRVSGHVAEVRVHSTAGGAFRLANPWVDARIRRAAARPIRCADAVLELPTRAGERLVLDGAVPRGA